MPEAQRPAYDPACYLCPGNARAGGARNPQYTGTYVFDNDFPALTAGEAPQSFADGPLLVRSESGVCRVVCFSPRHDLDVARMQLEQVCAIVETWAQQYRELGANPAINAITIFENRGAMMGASNTHPHGQIWAQHSLPSELSKESRALADRARTGACLLCEYVAYEQTAAQRIVYENASAVAVVPFWATWPFETLVVPSQHALSLDALPAQQREGFAEAMHAVTSRYDRLFDAPFPYSMGVHQAPTDGQNHTHWHLHAHYYPPLLRSALRKFFVGYEMLAEPQRDITPEEAARRLRER